MPDYAGYEIGNYQIIKTIGGGGFADVYLGSHKHLHNSVAIKVLFVQN